MGDDLYDLGHCCLVTEDIKNVDRFDYDIRNTSMTEKKAKQQATHRKQVEQIQDGDQNKELQICTKRPTTQHKREEDRNRQCREEETQTATNTCNNNQLHHTQEMHVKTTRHHFPLWMVIFT